MFTHHGNSLNHEGNVILVQDIWVYVAGDIVFPSYRSVLRRKKLVLLRQSALYRE